MLEQKPEKLMLGSDRSGMNPLKQLQGRVQEGQGRQGLCPRGQCCQG